MAVVMAAVLTVVAHMAEKPNNSPRGTLLEFLSFAPLFLGNKG